MPPFKLAVVERRVLAGFVKFKAPKCYLTHRPSSKHISTVILEMREHSGSQNRIVNLQVDFR